MNPLEKQLERDEKRQRKSSEEALPAWARKKQDEPLKNKNKKKKKSKK
jgi:hypothetical protein